MKPTKRKIITLAMITLSVLILPMDAYVLSLYNFGALSKDRIMLFCNITYWKDGGSVTCEGITYKIERATPFVCERSREEFLTTPNVQWFSKMNVPFRNNEQKNDGKKRCAGFKQWFQKKNMR